MKIYFTMKPPAAECAVGVVEVFGEQNGRLTKAGEITPGFVVRGLPKSWDADDALMKQIGASPAKKTEQIRNGDWAFLDEAMRDVSAVVGSRK